MKICYKFPSRSRPEKFFKALDSIINLARHDNYFILATLDADDETMNNANVIGKMETYGEVLLPVFGKSDNKIAAINRDSEFFNDCDLLLLHSDDMVFIKEAFDLVILKAFEDFDGLLHFPDQVVKNTLCTYPMMTKNYFQSFGYIYNPDYISLWADNEQMEVAKMLGKYKFIDENILEHRHPIWGLAEMDEQYIKSESFYSIDHATYLSRKAKNFDL